MLAVWRYKKLKKVLFWYISPLISILSYIYIYFFFLGGGWQAGLAILIIPIRTQACCWNSFHLKNLVWTLFLTSLSLHFPTLFSRKMLRAVQMHTISDLSLQFHLKSTLISFYFSETFLAEVSPGASKFLNPLGRWPSSSYLANP